MKVFFGVKVRSDWKLAQGEIYRKHITHTHTHTSFLHLYDYKEHPSNSIQGRRLIPLVLELVDVFAVRQEHFPPYHRVT